MACAMLEQLTDPLGLELDNAVTSIFDGTTSNNTTYKNQEDSNSTKRKRETKKATATPKKQKSDIDTRKYTYTELKRNVDKWNFILGKIEEESKSLDTSLTPCAGSAKTEVQKIIKHYKKLLDYQYCAFCKQSPEISAQVARGACGHLFSCLKCFPNYVRTVQSEFYCPRCNKVGEITLSMKGTS